MKLDVPVGDVIDKITILEIKKQKIKDEKKLQHVNEELKYLKQELKTQNVKVSNKLKKQLLEVNKKIWLTEDTLREDNSFKDSAKLRRFITHAVMNAKLNDERFLIKNKINKTSKSLFQEQKAHDGLYSAD